MSDGYKYTLIPGTATIYGAEFTKKRSGEMLVVRTTTPWEPKSAPIRQPLVYAQIKTLYGQATRPNASDTDIENSKQFKSALDAIDYVRGGQSAAAAPQTPGQG